MRDFLAGYARLSSKELEICDALARGLERPSVRRTDRQRPEHH